MTPSISLAALAVAAACGGSKVAPSAAGPAADRASAAAADTTGPPAPVPAREPLATAVVDAYSNWNGLFSSLVATWTPDGKRFVFGSRRDGRPEIYEADPARPSTDPAPSPPARSARSGPAIPATASRSCSCTTCRATRTTRSGACRSAVASRSTLPPARTREPSSHLYRLELGSGEPRLIYSQPQPGSAIDVTGDGKRVLISTDDGDHVALLALDAATGKEVARYVDRIRTAALSFAVSPAGDRVALGVDAGNHGEPRILDAHTLAVQRTVAVPLGDVKLGAWRPDGRAFSALISIPDTPSHCEVHWPPLQRLTANVPGDGNSAAMSAAPSATGAGSDIGSSENSGSSCRLCGPGRPRSPRSACWSARWIGLARAR